MLHYLQSRGRCCMGRSAGSQGEGCLTKLLLPANLGLAFQTAGEASLTVQTGLWPRGDAQHSAGHERTRDVYAGVDSCDVPHSHRIVGSNDVERVPKGDGVVAAWGPCSTQVCIRLQPRVRLEGEAMQPTPVQVWCTSFTSIKPHLQPLMPVKRLQLGRQLEQCSLGTKVAACK